MHTQGRRNQTKKLMPFPFPIYFKRVHEIFTVFFLSSFVFCLFRRHFQVTNAVCSAGFGYPPGACPCVALRQEFGVASGRGFGSLPKNLYKVHHTLLFPPFFK
jgi:hypothetical protein